MPKFVSALRAARLAAGFTQQELAAEIGTTQGILSSLENEETPPRLDLARKLATALEKTIDELFPPDPPRRANRTRALAQAVS